MKPTYLTLALTLLLAGCGSGGGGGGSTVAPTTVPPGASTPTALPPTQAIPDTTIQARFGASFEPTPDTFQFGTASVPGEFNYQSYGSWTNAPGDIANLLSQSTGQATPASAIPTTGTANFTGSARGVYTHAGNASRQPTTADMNAAVNFGTREIGLTTSNTFVLSGAGEGQRPDLNIAGTLKYGPGVNNFSGPVTTPGNDLAGAAQGRFYGPSAQELGGVYSLSSPSGGAGMTGGFGGKKQ